MRALDCPHSMRIPRKANAKLRRRPSSHSPRLWVCCTVITEAYDAAWGRCVEHWRRTRVDGGAGSRAAGCMPDAGGAALSAANAPALPVLPLRQYPFLLFFEYANLLTKRKWKGVPRATGEPPRR